MYAVYSLNNKSLAIETECIKGFSLKGEIYPLPNSPDFLVGITAIKGQLFSVVDIFALNNSGQLTVPRFEYVIRLNTPFDFLLTSAVRPELIDDLENVVDVEVDENIKPVVKNVFYHNNVLTYLLDIDNINAALEEFNSQGSADKEE